MSDTVISTSIASFNLMAENNLRSIIESCLVKETKVINLNNSPSL